MYRRYKSRGELINSQMHKGQVFLTYRGLGEINLPLEHTIQMKPSKRFMKGRDQLSIMADMIFSNGPKKSKHAIKSISLLKIKSK